MKISDNTMQVLKNYASINESIIFRPGSKLNTVSNAGNLMSFTDIEEVFEVEAPIYNLNQFLNTLSLFSDPELDFKSNHVLITDSNQSSVNYFYASSEVIDIADRRPNMKETVLEFLLEPADLNALTKAAGILNLEDLILSPSGNDLILSAVDTRNPTSNNFSRVVGDNTLEVDFSLKFKTSSIKLIPGDYNVTISSSTDKNGKTRFLASFESSNSTLIYFVALDPSSTMS